ncbi:MAG: RagB/SusD family nutrient uptake outer membrane protein [Bacteroides sp.]|nr:RagB/SusD family nutrient uptake outer membrane protein [Bacteroides sp.]
MKTTMKKNILYIGLALLGLTSCSDFLEVDAPSAFTDDYVFSNTDEANRLLNGVYTDLAANNLFGNAIHTTFCLNSDVEFTTSTNELQSASHNEYKLFDCEADASSLLSTWNAGYAIIESANNFVGAAEQSELFAAQDTTLLQMIGEAKCMRAMTYLEMVIMFGDIPFSLTRTYDSESLVMPMGDRNEILTALIDDLRATAPTMSYASLLSAGVERCSKEFCWSLIARLALYRGGYSLYPGESASDVGTMQRPSDYLDYYEIARNYCDSVISSGTHTLSKDYFDVFIDECNYVVASGDDPIFEIPFTMNVSGNIGYVHGPAGSESSAGGTEGLNQWGTASGSVRLNAFYRFTFDEQDARRDIVGFWSYAYDGTPSLLNNYNNYCNKWSKFWDANHTMGYQSSGSTGINFPYMRYADVLLMYAEAENELNGGPTDDAKSALKAVRERAFRGASNSAEMVDAYVDAATSKDDFFDLIVDERAWEFGGEAMRWKDLVRWNLYNQVVYKTFFQYYGKAAHTGGDTTYDLYDEFDSYPTDVYYKQIDNPADGSYPNTVLPILQFFTNEEYGVDNLWKNLGTFTRDHPSLIPSTTGSDPWSTAQFFSWNDEDLGLPTAQCRCSLRGYIYIDEMGIMTPSTMPDYTLETDLTSLPPVRYILPIPSDAISRSNGTYTNYYGY